MSRIDAAFAKARAEKRAALIVFITAGDPDLATTAELIVPAAWTSHYTIGWGNPAKFTTHLWLSPCPATKTGAHWLAFAGGYTLDRPACVPLIVKTASAQRVVHIGAGKPCPGERPPA